MERMDNEQFTLGMMVLTKLNAAASFVANSVMAFAVAMVMDTIDLIALAYGMLLLNVLSGYIIMLKHKTGWDKDKWFKTCMKLLWFPIVILATKAVQKVYGFDLPLAAIVAAFITVHDLRSLLTNAGELTGLDLWNAIASIDWKTFKRK